MSVLESSNIFLPPDVNSDALILHYGWSQDLGRLLVEKSQEQHIEERTPKDADEYFTDPDAADKWYYTTAKEPLIVWLGSLTGDLAGIAWITNPDRLRKKQLSAKSNFGVRVYEGYQEQGVATELSTEIHHRYDELPRSQVQFTTQTDNNAAFALAIKFGYKLDDQQVSLQGNMTMVRRGRSLV